LRGGPVIPRTRPPRTTRLEGDVGRWRWLSNLNRPSPETGDVVVPASSYLGMAGAYGSHIPDPIPEDGPVPDHRDNRRPYRFPATPGGDRSNSRRPHIITPLPEPPLPDLPAGTLLHLLPGEWLFQPGRHPGDQIVMRVVEVLADRPRPDGSVVWVTGHGVECSWPSSTCRTPCYELLAGVAALRRAVGW
jgi:hypothetical protein